MRRRRHFVTITDRVSGEFLSLSRSLNTPALNIFKARLPAEFNKVDGGGKPHNIG